MKFFPTPPITQLGHESETLNYSSRTAFCSQCRQKYEEELQKLMNEESEKSSSGVKTDSTNPVLPHWLQKAKARASDVEPVDARQVNFGSNLTATLYFFLVCDEFMSEIKLS